MTDKIIFVLYINVSGIEPEDIAQYAKNVSETLFSEEVSKMLNSTTFIIPTFESETRIDLIYPKIVVSKELEEHFETTMKRLNNHLDAASTNK